MQKTERKRGKRSFNSWQTLCASQEPPGLSTSSCSQFIGKSVAAHCLCTLFIPELYSTAQCKVSLERVLSKTFINQALATSNGINGEVDKIVREGESLEVGWGKL